MFCEFIREFEFKLFQQKHIFKAKHKILNITLMSYCLRMKYEMPLPSFCEHIHIFLCFIFNGFGLKQRLREGGGGEIMVVGNQDMKKNIDIYKN